MTKKVKSAKKEESKAFVFSDEQEKIRELADKIEDAIADAEPIEGFTQDFVGRAFTLVLSRRAYHAGMHHTFGGN